MDLHLLITRLRQVAQRYAAGDPELRALIDDLVGALPRTPTRRLGEAPDLEDHAKSDVSEDPRLRYEDLGLLGVGGFSEVREVLDRHIERRVARKEQLVARSSEDDSVRFREEVRITAALQHPGVVPLYDWGFLPDGRVWFTMKRVRGDTIGKRITALHQLSGEEFTLGLRRLLDDFRRLCEPVAYAHAQRIIHRDLTPQNLMVGELGEVHVMDWGLARDLDRGLKTSQTADAPQPEDEGAWEGAMLTRVTGTPRYMSPEQARGEIAAMGPESDVYTLGAVLYEILSGHPPYLSTSTAADSPERIVVQVRSGPPPSIEERARREIPAELRALTAKAMARARPDRYPDAGALMEAVRDWLDGASRRERALAIVREANHAHLATIERMRAEADRLRARAKEILDRLQTFDKAQAKAEGWKLEDDAAAIEQAALREEIHWTQKLRSALNEAPDLEEAHETLAEHYAHRSQHAEAERDQPAATRFAALLDEHAGKLREERRTHYEARSRGDGRLTFLTEPASARVLLKRYEPVLRYLRLDERSAQQLRSPIRALDLPRGSYLLLVTAPGYRDLRYPVMIGRGEHWDGVRPGSEEPLPIPLLRDDALGPDDIYVPAGPCISGGDPHAGESLSRRKFWIDGFVIQKHPITNADYVSFLNALASRGMHAEARRAHRPKTKRSISRRQKVRRRACRRSRSSSRRLGGTLSRAELREAGAIVPTGQGEVLRSSRACLVVQALLARPVLPLYHCAARAEHRIGVAFAILLPPRSYADRTEHMPTTTRMCRRGLLEGEIECLSSTNQVRQHTIASRAPTHASQSSRLLSFKNRVYPHFRHDSPGAISHLTRSTSGDEIGIALGPASMSRKGITMKITTMFTSVLVLATITAGCGTPELSEEELGVAYQRQLPVDARQNYVTEVTFTTGAYVAFRGVITNNTTVGSYNSDTEYWYTRSQALGSSISMSASANTYTGTQLDSFHSDCTTAYDTTQVVGTSGWTQGTYAAPSGSVLYRATDPDNGSVSIGMLVTQDSGSELKTIVWYKTANTGTVFATTPSSLSWTQVFDGSRQPSTDPADISSSATWYHTSP